MKVLGLLFEGADPSAALVVDGEVIAFAEEERFNRQKHADCVFPIQAVEFCLQQGHLSASDLDLVTIGWDTERFDSGQMEQFYSELRAQHPLSSRAMQWQDATLDRYRSEKLLRQIEEGLGFRPEVRFLHHHLCHAASTFALSGFESAAVITADGHGEEDCTHLWHARDGQLRSLQKWDLPQSLGWFYTKFTQFFGFRAHDGEGKLMGLAAYGQPRQELQEKVGRVLRLTGDERVYWLEPRFFFGEFVSEGPYTAEWMELFGPPRAFESKEPFSSYHHDLAYAVQDALEQAGLGLMERALELTGESRVCTAGGSFMNCKMNGELARRVGWGNYFVQPAAGDNGISLGAALVPFLEAGSPIKPLTHMYWGPEFSEAEMETALQEAGISYHRSQDVISETASLLANSQVVGWFQGRMEAGARALGNRSILANPLDPEMSDLVNNKVKFREAWRPFCPSTTVESGHRYFDFEGPLPYMIVACDARPGEEERLPSVVHVDNTVRVQTVHPDTNPRYHQLITEFGRISGHPVVLNTSFNIKGEPIICRPSEAVTCFLNTAIDALVMGDFVALKSSSA